MLKKCAVLTLLFAAAGANAQTEQGCLQSGKVAEVAANLMSKGASEESVIATLRSAADPKRPKARQEIMTAGSIAIVNYVYTMKPTPSEARSTVYLKCMTGGLGYIDWSKHPEAVHAK